MVCIGSKASAFFRRLKVNMLGSVTHLGDKPQLEQLVGAVKVMLDAYAAGNARPRVLWSTTTSSTP